MKVNAVDRQISVSQGVQIYCLFFLEQTLVGLASLDKNGHFDRVLNFSVEMKDITVSFAKFKFDGFSVFIA